MLESPFKKAAQTASESDAPLDSHIGFRLRKIRALLGMTQEQLGRALGITFQQVQKYEHGTNRIAASRLFVIAKVFNVSVAYFFEDVPVALGGSRSRDVEKIIQASKTADDGIDKHTFEHREMLEFTRTYNRIGNSKIRRKIYELMRSVAGDDA